MAQNYGNQALTRQYTINLMSDRCNANLAIIEIPSDKLSLGTMKNTLRVKPVSPVSQGTWPNHSPDFWREKY